MSKLTNNQLSAFAEFSSNVAKEVLTKDFSSEELLERLVLLQSRIVRLEVEIVQELRNPWIRAIETFADEPEEDTEKDTEEDTQEDV